MSDEEKHWAHFLALAQERRGTSEELDLSQLTEAELGVPPHQAKSYIRDEVFAEFLTTHFIPLNVGIERSFFYWAGMSREEWLAITHLEDLYCYQRMTTEEWQDITARK